MTTPNIDAYLDHVHTALSNLRDDPELNGPMAPAGFPATRITELFALYNAANTAHLTQKTEYAEQYGATAAFNQACEAAYTAYMRHLALARVVFKKDVNRIHQLGLQGERKYSFSGWKAQAEQFYTAAINDPAIRTPLAGVGITAQALDDASALLQAADTAHHTQQRETGEAQEATLLRDDAVDTLQDAFSDLVTIARVVFADDPQKLERLGIFVPSPGYTPPSPAEEEVPA